MEEMIGEWIILKNEEIIEHDRDLKVILKKSENYKDDEITISRIPSATYGFY